MIFHIGSGQTQLTYQIHPLGRDLLITITGGEAHVGSLSIANQGKVTTTTLEGHRDDALSQSLAESIAHRFPGVCTVVAGFHLDNITKEQIFQVLDHHNQGIQKVLCSLSQQGLLADERSFK